MNACEAGDLTAVKLLCQHDKSLLEYVCESGGPLHAAITSQQRSALEVAGYLLGQNSSLANKNDLNNISPIYLACYAQNEALVKLLLQHGADPLVCN